MLYYISYLVNPHVRLLEYRHLTVFLLLLPLKMQPQHRFIHHPAQKKHLLDLLNLRDSTEFIMEGNCDLGFEEFFLLFSTWHTTFIVSKLIIYVK